MIAAIAELFFSDRSDPSDHMETGLQRDLFCLEVGNL